MLATNVWADATQLTEISLRKNFLIYKKIWMGFLRFIMLLLCTLYDNHNKNEWLKISQKNWIFRWKLFVFGIVRSSDFEWLSAQLNEIDEE